MQSNIPSLQEQQNRLLTDIFSRRSTDNQGIQVYQNNLLMTAARSLSITYPVLEHMIGEQPMIALARELLQTTPPGSGDWADWGEHLADLITQTPLADDAPFLADMARLEWAIHEAGRHYAAPFDTQSLTLLSEHDPNNLYLVFPTTFHVIASEFPIDLIWQAHKTDSGEIKLDQQRLADALAADHQPCYLRIDQQHLVPNIARLTADDFAWERDALNQQSLGTLLDAHPEFDLGVWLAEASSHHRLRGLRLALYS
ncbi:Uncharacterised protein [BD1-7 clade bacterium]|uniref:Putative DNA-binding domain-containing protein n=1 Tax=BD1-7 clade bacterium TaxID=2029982 RepID=A0A5S9QRM8_9GAMM|nr:Uncharacterised protein [BD1-7 clade bacterium]CAA0122338.1 Uncharacterised protein [BD1-7 clade bacterium]